MIDLTELDSDLQSVGLDEKMRLAFLVLAKHINFMMKERDLSEARIIAMAGYPG